MAQFRIFFLLLSLVSICYIYIDSQQNASDETFCREKVLTAQRSGAIIILMATTYFEENYREDPGEKNCSRKCVILPPQCRKFPTLALNADAVVFHAFRPDLVPALRSLLPRQSNKQVWILLSMETPVTLERLTGRVAWWRLNNIFNWSASYRKDADIFIPPVQFDGFEKVPANSVEMNLNFKSSKRHIVAVISNCNDASGRLALLKQLSSLGLSVDIYGKCSPNGLQCILEHRQCLRQLEGKYVFYAAFENSICRDYVTEKFYEILDFDYIPLVLGGFNYSSSAPANSFVNVGDFESTSQLAHFLLKIANNATLYASFFEWKRHFYVRRNAENLPMCSICRKLYSKNYEHDKMLGNIERFFDGTKECS